MWSLSLVISECSLSGRGQGHVSNFYIVDLENFVTASRRYTGDIHNSVRSRFVNDIYKTMEATRSRHGWVHMFIAHRPTLTLQLHNFDLFRTCRTSSFCIVAWQLARFQLTRRIARSLGDSWASCKLRYCDLLVNMYKRCTTSGYVKDSVLTTALYTGWQWRNFDWYLCQLIFAAITWVKLSEMFATMI